MAYLKNFFLFYRNPSFLSLPFSWLSSFLPNLPSGWWTTLLCICWPAQWLPSSIRNLSPSLKHQFIYIYIYFFLLLNFYKRLLELRVKWKVLPCTMAGCGSLETILTADLWFKTSLMILGLLCSWWVLFECNINLVVLLLNAEQLAPRRHTKQPNTCWLLFHSQWGYIFPFFPSFCDHYSYLPAAQSNKCISSLPAAPDALLWRRPHHSPSSQPRRLRAGNIVHHNNE